MANYHQLDGGFDHEAVWGKLDALQAAISADRYDTEIRVASLEDQLRLAANWSSRRASVAGSVDNWTHRVGSAIAAAGGQGLEADGLLGLFAGGPLAIMLTRLIHEHSRQGFADPV